VATYLKTIAGGREAKQDIR